MFAVSDSDMVFELAGDCSCFRLVVVCGVFSTASATCHGTVIDGRRESPGGGAITAF